jgi:hypothetical protein
MPTRVPRAVMHEARIRDAVLKTARGYQVTAPHATGSQLSKHGIQPGSLRLSPAGHLPPASRSVAHGFLAKPQPIMFCPSSRAAPARSSLLTPPATKSRAAPSTALSSSSPSSLGRGQPGGRVPHKSSGSSTLGTSHGLVSSVASASREGTQMGDRTQRVKKRSVRYQIVPLAPALA